MNNLRIGLGYDVHPFAKGRKLVLGGVRIPSRMGLSGHSDADVLIHAICDAILGAIGKGDIGKLFPNTDKKYKNAPSTDFLEHIGQILSKTRSKIINIDSMVLAEKPMIAPYSLKMRKTIAKCLKIGADRVSIKATTNEGIGFVGRGEGIACFSTVLIIKRNS